MKQTDAHFACLLSPLVPSTIDAWLVGYLRQSDTDRLLFCAEVVAQGAFLHLTILSKDNDSHWKIRLPIQSVLLIMDLSDKEALHIGFLKS